MTRCFSNNRFAARRYLTLVAVLVMASFRLCATATAMPVMPVDAPVPRLLANVGAYVKQHPQDPNGYYALGRIHYFAFAAPARRTMPVIQPDIKRLPIAPGYDNPGRIPSVRRKAKAGEVTAGDQSITKQTQSERKNHVQAAIQNLRQAIHLQRREPQKSRLLTYERVTQKGLAELTLACVYEEGKSDASKAWQDEAIRFYRLAYERSSAQTLSQPEAPIFGIQTLVSHEAGRSYLRLVQLRGVRQGEKNTVAAVERAVRLLESLPPSRYVTPIIFALDKARPLTTLVAPRPEGVAFDLDGSARADQLYNAWPRGDTGILVWDPTHTGRITSGRQLFGSVTWWIFWENGYRALQSLDDDQDGWLTEAEMNNLGVWNDRNSNGKCESGEVVRLSQTPIAGLNVRDAQPTRTGWACKMGIRLQNGTYLPTYDWTVSTTPGK